MPALNRVGDLKSRIASIAATPAGATVLSRIAILPIMIRALRVSRHARALATASPSPFTLPREMPHVDVDVDEGTGVAVVELNRHSKLNALSRSMARDVAAAVAALDEHPPVRAIVLAGGPRAFAAGADVEGIAGDENEEGGSNDYGGDKVDGGSWMDTIDNAKTPIVAAVDGFALGPGCGLALASDIVIAGQGAKFGVPDVCASAERVALPSCPPCTIFGQ